MKRSERVAARGGPLAVLLLAVLLIGIQVLGVGANLQVEQQISPQQIYVAGTGSPDTSVVSLALDGAGPEARFPIDYVFVIDVSATAQIDIARQLAFDLMNSFSDQDQIGLVTFSTTAQLAVPLTADRLKMKTAIADLNTGGKSAFGDALQLARQELLARGRPNAILVEILMTDGQNNSGRDPQGEGDIASEAGIRIIPVGIGNLIDSNLLEQLATDTNGRFFKRATDSVVDQINQLISVKTAGTVVTVRKTLPSSVQYVSADPAPTRIVSNPDRTTTLIWQIASISLDEEWSAAITLKAISAGTLNTDQGSTVTYTDFRGVKNTIGIPSVTLHAIVPPAPPAPPIAAFDYVPATPSTTDMVTFSDRSSDKDGQVVAWAWAFGDGDTSADQNPTHSYAHSGSYSVTLVVTDNDGYKSDSVTQVIRVKNTGPMAVFRLTPDKPRVAVTTTFDASGSNDIDGHIVSYAWDFDGDGQYDAETASSDIDHVFAVAGETSVALKVTDDEGASAVVRKSLTVLPSVSAVRTIDTCLPGDKTIAAGTVTVTLTITANTTVNGLTLHEDVPAGWTFAAGDNASATLHKGSGDNAQGYDWLFMETLRDGDTRVITYSLTAPSTPPDKTEVSINGIVQSSSPRLSRMVLGEDKIVFAPTLPIKVVISRWDVDQEKIVLCLPDQISFDQIQYAVSLWLNGNPVTYTPTDNNKITLDQIRDLVAYWLTNTSVHEPLP